MPYSLQKPFDINGTAVHVFCSSWLRETEIGLPLGKEKKGTQFKNTCYSTHLHWFFFSCN